MSNNPGYEGDLEIAMLPDSFRTDVLKETMDSNSVLIEDATVETAAFALLFEFDGDQKKIRHVMYNCTATRPTIESATNEEEIEVKTETLTIKASPLEGGYVKARTSDNTNATAYNNWYSSVYMPQNATFGVSPSSMILGLEDSGTATIAGALGTVTAAVTIEGETTGMVQAVVSGSTLTISTTDQTREAEYVVTLTDGGRTTGNTATVEVTVVDEGE